MNLSTILCMALVLPGTFAANILLVGTLLSHSHHFWNEAVAIGLVDKGHNVTILSHDKSNVRRENYTVITLEGVYEAFDSTYTMDSMSHFTITPLKIPSFVHSFIDFSLTMCKYDINHPTLHNVLLAYPKNFKFDVILWDNTAGECLYPIVQRFGNPPVVGLSPFGLTNFVEAVYGGHVYPYVGQVSMPFVVANTLWERLLNIIYINYSNYKRDTTLKLKSVELSKTVFPDWDEQKYEDLENRFSLCLINWNVALNVPQPLSPNLIPVGGVQIKANEVLPKNLQHIFGKPSKGVIFFSLGSNIKSEILSLEVLQSFCDCFAELPDYQFLWKIKAPTELKLPGNTITTPWAPQTAILAQNKTRLFISHAGGLSIQETAHFGVPVVAVPVFLDQINNAQKLKEIGGAEIIRLSEMKTTNRGKDMVCDKVKKVLHTASYTQNMKDLSARYRGGERTPLQTAVHWVEYVLRHGDAKHLSPLSRNVSVFHSQHLDIYAAIVGFVILQVLILYGVVRFVLRLCTGTKGEKVKTN